MPVLSFFFVFLEMPKFEWIVNSTNVVKKKLIGIVYIRNK